MSLIVARESFRLTRGEPRTFATSGDSGARKDCAFCGSCGTRIYNQISSMPATLNLKPGTLDDTSWLAPRMQVWRTSKQPWVELPDCGPTFEGNPTRPA